MIIQEIWGLIPAYTKNWLVSWFDDKEQLSGADVIGWNSLSKKKNSCFGGLISVYQNKKKARFGIGLKKKKRKKKDAKM